jgi:hypothetical protein
MLFNIVDTFRSQSGQCPSLDNSGKLWCVCVFPVFLILIGRYLCRYTQAQPARRIKDVCTLLEANSRHVLALRARVGLTPKQGELIGVP